MPILQNPRHEAFAQSRSRGALLDEAYEHAGFIPGHGHASRLAATPRSSSGSPSSTWRGSRPRRSPPR